MSTSCPIVGFFTRWVRPWQVALATGLTVAIALFFCDIGAPIADGTPVETDATADGGSLLNKQAPELEGGTAWLNSAGPLRLADLKGHIVLLDFWTLCCINCIHTLPDLARLEALYQGLLVVIGIHTPKFENEKDTESIRKAILRYEIAHPVINDSESLLARRYKFEGWPTLVLIDPEGVVRYVNSGEGQFDVLNKNISELVQIYRAKKMLNEKPLRFELARFSETGASPLFFPGKVLADKASNRLFIADSTHHRIVITDLAGKKIAIAGTGASGLKNGTFDQATFSDPQGMALNGDMLYVADRRNHVIRRLDLQKKTVATAVGTGVQNGFQRKVGGPALQMGLNSPWDLLLHDRKLYIAMAGHHQIWLYDLNTGRVDPFAGSGIENIADGTRATACFAQPSGLTTDGKTLWVADSETSSIRSLPISGGGQVKTVVGQGLFEFGDIDGVGEAVRLQHALGVAYKDGKLYVADTYNSKLKIIDPATRTCTTYLGERGGWLTASTFSEPGGLSFAGDKLFIADTNGHRIRVVDLKTNDVSTLALQDVTAPKLSEAKKN